MPHLKAPLPARQRMACTGISFRIVVKRTGESPYESSAPGGNLASLRRPAYAPCTVTTERGDVRADALLPQAVQCSDGCSINSPLKGIPTSLNRVSPFSLDIILT